MSVLKLQDFAAMVELVLTKVQAIVVNVRVNMQETDVKFVRVLDRDLDLSLLHFETFSEDRKNISP